MLPTYFGYRIEVQQEVNPEYNPIRPIFGSSIP